MKLKNGLIKRYIEEEDIEIYYTEEMLNDNIVICETTYPYEGTDGIDVETLISVKHYNDLDAWEYYLYWGEMLTPIQILRIVKDVYDLYREHSLNKFIEIIHDLSITGIVASIQSDLLNRVKIIKEIKDFFHMVRSEIMKTVCLVDFNKNDFKIVGKIDPSLTKDFKKLSEVLLEYCEKYSKELKNDLWLFVATKEPDGSYRAEYRATYAEWMVNENCDEKPYYIDVAESDERYMFHVCVNEKYFGI